jgi:uncharacterized protein YgbK (DUF1537 family)
MEALGTNFTIACPAFPENGRAVFKGHLFVGDDLLHESGMRHHPLTPMTDSNLVRVLQEQTRHKVGLIDFHTVSQGADAITKKIASLKTNGVSIAIVDAVTNEDLIAMGPALTKLPLLTAGSGVAIGLRPIKDTKNLEGAAQLPKASGFRAIISGSCSAATNEQVAHYLSTGGIAFAVDPLQLAQGHDVVAEALNWAVSHLSREPVLIYATAEPAAVKAAQLQLGVQHAGEIVEDALARIAKGLVHFGVRQLIVAGGETSGACVQALSIESLRIGPQIAPGVPWCHAASEDAPQSGLHIALKSGNFGSIDFFTNAFRILY